MIRHLCSLVILASLFTSARADDRVWATGRVMDGSRPVTGAVVAVYDKSGHVVDYARTDEDGAYALAIPRSALHLDKKDKNFLHQVSSSVSRLVGGVAGPVKMGIRAAAGASGFSGPVGRAGMGVASGVAQNLVDTLAPVRARRIEPTPGSVVMKVSGAGHNDAIALAHVYWMEEEYFRAGGKETRTLAAWLDPVKLTRPGSEKPSTIESKYLLFEYPRFEPSIVEVGQEAILSVKLTAPPDPRTPVVVVARNSRSGRLYELEPAGGDMYTARIQVDRSFPKHDQTFTILAYAEQSDRPGRNTRAEGAIQGAGLFDPHKPFVYNPFLVVSRNRAEVSLTVIEPPRRR